MERMSRRLLVLLGILAVLGVPAGVLRAVCAGNSCPEPVEPAEVPFCTLPDDVRARIRAGFRDGRSPEVLAVTARTTLAGGWGYGIDVAAHWPSIGGAADPAVPLVFAGAGIGGAAAVPDGTTLDAVAPTIAETIGLRRPNPGVRSGEAIAGVAGEQRPRLVLLVVWKGVGSEDLRTDRSAWPFLRSLIQEGTGTLRADPGSLPLDPTAVLTTIGTGGLPADHGITGRVLRNDEGKLTRAWGRGAPLSVIASLGDDLDDAYAQSARIGVAGSGPADRGIVGGTWYLDHDRDDVALGPGRDPAASAERLLRTGFGTDEVPDLFAVVMRDSIERMDASLERVAAAAREAAGGSVLVAVTATGPAAPDPPEAAELAGLVRDVEEAAGLPGVVEAAVPGGLFIDQDVLADRGVGSGAVVRALDALRGPGGKPLMADVFPGFAVSFARYC